MQDGQKIVVVMPAYNAARTLQRTYDEVVAQGIVDLVIVVDDASHDATVAIARTLERVRVEVRPKIAATTQIKKPVIASHWPRMRTLSL
jgi:glycosyltransferase involved in cell wall biosynthesis